MQTANTNNNLFVLQKLKQKVCYVLRLYNLIHWKHKNNSSFNLNKLNIRINNIQLYFQIKLFTSNKARIAYHIWFAEIKKRTKWPQGEVKVYLFVTEIPTHFKFRFYWVKRYIWTQKQRYTICLIFSYILDFYTHLSSISEPFSFNKWFDLSRI